MKCRCLQIKIFQDSRYQSLGKTNPSNPLIVEDYADDVLLGMLDPKVIRSVLQEFLGSKPFLAGSTVAAIILEMGFFDGIFGAKNFQKMGSNRWVQQPILYQPELPPLPGAFHQSRQVIPLKRREKNRQAATPDDGMVAMRGPRRSHTNRNITQSMQLKSQAVASSNFAKPCVHVACFVCV